MLFSTSIFFNHERRQDPGVLPYISHIDMCHPKGKDFLGPFVLKALCPFWSGVGYGFRGNYASVRV